MTTTATAAVPAASPTLPRRRRWWWRWTMRLLAIVVLLRVLLALFLADLLGVVAGTLGLTLHVQSTSLSLLGLSFRAEDLVVQVAGRPDVTPLLTAHDLVVDLSMHDLLAGRVVIVDAALTSARITIWRGPDGKLVLPAELTESAPVEEAPPPPEPAPFRFELPVEIRSARLHDVQLTFVDNVPAPPLAVTATVDLDAASLGDPQRTGTLAVYVRSPGWFDKAAFTATVLATGDRAEVEWQAVLHGVRPAALPVKLDLPPELQGELGYFDAEGALRGEVRADAPQMPAVTANVDVRVAHGDKRSSCVVQVGPLARNAAGGDDLPFHVALEAPAFVQQLRVDGGTLSRTGDAMAARGRVAVEGLTLTPLTTALRESGIVLPDGGLRIAAGFDVELGAGITASLHDAAIEGGGETVSLAKAAVNDLRSADGGLAIGSVEIDGPVAAARRDADGTLVLAGVRIVPVTAPPTPPAAPPAPRPAPFALPKVRLGSFAWRGVACTFTDATTQPPAAITIDEVDVSGDGLTIGSKAPDGRLAASLRVADTVESLQAELRLQSTESAVGAELQVDANGITAGALAPWLRTVGFAPALRSGRLRLLASASVERGDAGPTITARLADARFTDGDAVLLGVRNVTGSDVRPAGDVADLGTWRIQEPFVAVHRDANGLLHVAGLQQLAPDQAPAIAAKPPQQPRPAAPRSLPRARIAVDQAVLRWSVDGAPPCSFGVDATVDAGGGALPVTIESTLHVPGALQRAHLTAKLTPDAGWRIESAVNVEGIHGAGFAAVLPPHVRCALTDGAMQANVAAHVRLGTKTGLALQLDGLRLTDHGEELAALDHLELDAPEISAERVHVAKLDGRGFRALLTTTADGTLVAGLLLVPAAATDGSAPVQAQETPSTPLRLPVLAIDSLSLACERVAVSNRRETDSEPMVLTGTLTMEPWAPDLDSDDVAPAKLKLVAAATPLCKEVTADMTVNPYLLQPTANVVLAGKLDLTTIPRVSADLAKRVEGLTADAEFTATLNARFNLHRRDSRTIDPGRPFGAEIVCENLAFRDAANGTTWATVGLVDVDVRAIDPGTGDVLLRSIDVNDGVLAIAQAATGTEVLGMRLLPLAEPPTPIAAAVARQKPSQSELSVDRVSVDGFSIVVNDPTTTPPTSLPFTDVELSLKHFSTRSFTEARPFAFSLTMHGGDVPLPKRVLHGSFITGMLSSATGAVTGQGKDAIEQRALVDEITVAGQLQFVPFLRGQINTRVVDFELQGLAGLAKRSDVEISDGLVNHRSTMDIRGPEGAHMRADTVFTYLSISEPDGGPVSTYLRLPGTLGYVLFLLENDADEHRLPIEATVDTERLGSGAMMQAIADAITALVADAVASAPTRVTGTVTGFFGDVLGWFLGWFGVDYSGEFVAVTVAVPFAAADPLPGAVDVQAVLDEAHDEDIELVLIHELGEGDLPRAEALATPPPDVVARTVEHLRTRHAAMDAVRCTLATEIAALYATGRMQEAWVKQEQLVAEDNRLGELEQALDEALTMLAGDTPHAQRRRTQAAAQALGNKRLSIVQDRLRQLAPDLTEERIIVRPARAAVGDLPAGGRVIVTTRRRTAR